MNEIQERVFFCTKNGAHKFWRVWVQNEMQTVCWGRIGTVGQTLLRTFADFDEAKAASEITIAHKVEKGYVEVSREEANATVPVPLQRTGKRMNAQLFLSFDAEATSSAEIMPTVFRAPPDQPVAVLALFDL